MASHVVCNEELVRRLPLPLAQLYRRAHNAKTVLEQHLAAYYLWEAALKLLASSAVVSYAELQTHDPKITERLTNLARPSLGHWWEFIRLLVPALAEAGEPGFPAVRDLLLGRMRDDLPRCAGLDAALRAAHEGQEGARSTVRPAELFDRLVRYRNQELGHGATGQRSGEFYARMGQAILSGVAEMLDRLDILAGQRLLYIGEVRRQSSGAWQIQRYELVGETARRIETLEMEDAESRRLPRPELIYLDRSAGASGQVPLRCLHPLVIYQGEAGEAMFLNARRGRERTEYLSYTTGRVLEFNKLPNEQRALLARILGAPVSEQQAEGWATRSHAEAEALAPAPELRPAPARRLGEFDLLSKLGQGGMGVVYRAWQPSLGRQVAVKCLLRSEDPRAEARFAREIRALGRTEHPNLVKIFTSGTEGGHWFYAMELVEGATLAAVCERLQSQCTTAADLGLEGWHEALSTVSEEARQAEKPLDDTDPGVAPVQRAERVVSVPAPLLTGRTYVGQVVELMCQVCDAAHALHEAGIVHRDIKPGNIIVTADGSQAVLMDLGLAQLADDEEGRLTRTRQFVGTLRYASPQQVLAVGGLDRRSDVYGLGATLWELLALQPLFGATDETPTPELMEKIQREEPERLRIHHPGIGRDLEAIIHKCLEKSPDQRYATTNELARDLRRFLNGEPVRARPVSSWERAFKWVKRHPARAAVYGLICLVALLGLGGGGITWLWQSAETARGQAEKAKEEAQAARQQAMDANKKIGVALQREQEANQKTKEALKKEQEALKREQESNEITRVVLEKEKRLNSWADLLADRRYQDARELTTATNEAKWVLADVHASAEAKARAQFVIGLADRNRGEFAQARQAFEQAIKAALQAKAVWAPAAQATYWELTEATHYYLPSAQRLYARGDLQAALADLDAAALGFPEDGRVLALRGLVRLEMPRAGHLDAATQQLIRQDAAAAKKDARTSAEGFYVLGRLEEELRDFDRAEKDYRDALSAHQGSPDQASRYVIALARMVQRGIPISPASELEEDPATAARLREAIKLANIGFKSADPKTRGKSYLVLGRAYTRMGKRTEGLMCYVKGMALTYPGEVTRDLAMMVENHPAFRESDPKDFNEDHPKKQDKKDKE